MQNLDSPNFGNPLSSQPSFKRSQPISPLNNQDPIDILAALTLHQNLRKFKNALRNIELRKKRQGFIQISLYEKDRKNQSIRYSNKQMAIVLKIERNFENVYRVLGKYIMKDKLGAMQRLKYARCGLDEISKKSVMRSERVAGKTRNVSEWKQNSNYNILDLSLQNRKLREDIKKEKSTEELMIEKMSVMLDAHYEKLKGKKK